MQRSNKWKMPESYRLKISLNTESTKRMEWHYMQYNKNYNVVLRDKCAESMLTHFNYETFAIYISFRDLIFQEFA